MAAMNAVTNTLKILEILEAAQIEQPRAKAIAAAIGQAIQDHDGDLKTWMREQQEWMGKTFASKADLAEVKSELMKWMFLFTLGQTAVLAGILKLLIP